MRMFALTLTAVCLVLALLALGPHEARAECTVCHSKNPKMVRMHEALEFKGCFNCHFQGRIAEPQDMPRQMRTDPLCKDCHATGPLPDPKDLKKSSPPGGFPIP